MKKLKLIYNPFSGNKSFKRNLDLCISIFQQGGYDVRIFRSMEKGDIARHIAEMDDDNDIIVVSGGDGTINIAADALLKRGLETPIGIIPSGTANDFASFIGLKNLDIEKCCKLIVSKEPIKVDVGEVNGRYFINVCAAGYFANVSQDINADFKNALGNISYYIKGMEQIANLSPIKYRITNSQNVFEEDLYLFLILNSASAGSLNKLSPLASVTDGMFEFIGIKAKPIYEIAVLLVKILRGEHTDDPNVVYFRDNFFRIECLSDNKGGREVDIDGEQGPNFPIEVNVCKQKIKVIANNDI